MDDRGYDLIVLVVQNSKKKKHNKPFKQYEMRNIYYNNKTFCLKIRSF